MESIICIQARCCKECYANNFAKVIQSRSQTSEESKLFETLCVPATQSYEVPEVILSDNFCSWYNLM